MPGDGAVEHLGEFDETPAAAPKIQLANGLFEIGRVPPADIVVPIPSVSARHAMLRIGTRSTFQFCHLSAFPLFITGLMQMMTASP